jgi:hypothetical protein
MHYGRRVWIGYYGVTVKVTIMIMLMINAAVEADFADFGELLCGVAVARVAKQSLLPRDCWL